jgi:uncharacterized DUF497 family protein
MNIIWDSAKAKANLKKHGVHFSDAETAFFDPFALTIEAQDADGEQRFVTLGTDALGRVLVVIYTFWGEAIRLISARRATPTERKQYEKGI